MKYYGKITDPKDLVTKEKSTELAQQEIAAAIDPSTGTAQAKLVSGTNIKTINNQDVLGSGNLEIGGADYTAGNNITINNNTISALKYYKKSEVTGVAGTSTTQVSTTYDVTDISVTEYYDGMMVTFVLPVAGVNTYGSVLQFNSLGYKPIVYNNASAIGTRYGTGSQITAVYNSIQTAAAYFTKATKTTVTGCWQICDYDKDTTDAMALFDTYFKPYAGSNIYRYKLCMQDKDNRLQPIVTTDQTSTTQVVKEVNTTPLRPENIWFYDSETTTSAGSGVPGKSLKPSEYGAYCAYNFNETIAAYRMLYLAGSYNETTGLFTLDNSTTTSYYAAVPNKSANITLSNYLTAGKYYILVGSTYSNNDYISLFAYNPMYYFDGTNLVPYEQHVSESASNKVTSISSSSTDIEYPSAKAVYDNVVNKATVIVSDFEPASISTGDWWYHTPHIYSITNNLINCTKVYGPDTIVDGGSTTLVYEANRCYALPDSVTVTGATSTWTKETGTLVLSGAADNVNVTIEAELGPMPAKGQLINMTLGNGAPAAGTNNLYRVLSINGTIAEVVAMYDTNIACYYNSGGESIYSGAELDTALNTTFYNSLSAEAKAAIVAKNIISYEYTYNDSVFNETTHASYADYSTKAQHEAIGNRYVYALDVEDIETYFNNTFSTSDIFTLFWNTTSKPSDTTDPWLRSVADDEYAYYVDGDRGYVSDYSVELDDIDARPAFCIDLSKISWS